MARVDFIISDVLFSLVTDYFNTILTPTLPWVVLMLCSHPSHMARPLVQMYHSGAQPLTVYEILYVRRIL